MQCGAGGARTAPGRCFFGAERPAQAVRRFAGIPGGQRPGGGGDGRGGDGRAGGCQGAREDAGGRRHAAVAFVRHGDRRSVFSGDVGGQHGGQDARRRAEDRRGQCPHVGQGGVCRLGAGGVYPGGGVPGGDDVIDELLRGKDGVAWRQGQCPRRGEVSAAARWDGPGGVRRGAGATARRRNPQLGVRLAALHPPALRAGVREEPAVVQAGE